MKALERQREGKRRKQKAARSAFPYVSEHPTDNYFLCRGCLTFGGQLRPPSELSAKSPDSNLKEVASSVARLAEACSAVVMRAVDFSSVANLVAVDSDNAKINIWDWHRNRIAKTLENPQGSDNGLATNPLQFSRDGQFFAACISKGVGDLVIRVWTTANWTIAKDVVDDGPGSCNSLLMSPDGKYLFYVYRHDFPDFISRHRNRLERQIHCALGALAWSHDGNRIAMGGRSNVETFDTKTGQSVLREDAEETNIRYSSDGRYLVESDHNETGRGTGLKIWDNARQQLLQQFEGDIGSIAVSQDGRYLAVGETGHTSIFQFK